MENVKITKVFKTNKNKEGQPLINKFGKNYWKISIKTDRYPDDWLGAFASYENDPVMMLDEGTEIKLKITENGRFKNFRLPTQIDYLEERVSVLEKKLNPTPSPSKAPAMINDIPIEDKDLPW